MNITRIVVGQLKANCYIIYKDNKAIIIDPGSDENKIVEYLKAEKLIPKAIFLTHGHFDHIGCAQSISDIYSIPIYSSSNLFEQKYNIEGFYFQVIYTFGHTNDSITYYFPNDDLMFVGDFIFKESIGRVDLPTGNYQDMINSINKIKTYDDEIVLYPGHGEDTTIKYEKEYNPYFN